MALPNGTIDRTVYLDYAAATPLAPEVAEAMQPYWTDRFYNPSAPYAPARSVRADIESSRARLGRVLGSRAGNITLTAGATEANNLAFASVTGEVISDAIEHDSVLECARVRGGTIVGVDEAGVLSPESIRRALTPKTELVSIGLANGEIGTIQPIRQIAAVVAEERMRRLEARNPRPLLLHVDASQAAGHVSVNVSTLGVDLMTISAAKVYGPKQVGLLWHADGVALRPLLLGGGQEGGMRSGTENVPGTVGFARALELCEQHRAKETRRLRNLTSVLRKGLRESLDGVVFSGPSKDRQRLDCLVHASFMGLEARRLVVALERRGVLVGTGSACAASRMHTSHVLRAIGLDDAIAQGSIRMTVGRYTTLDDVSYALDTIVACVREERERTGWRA